MEARTRGGTSGVAVGQRMGPAVELISNAGLQVVEGAEGLGLGTFQNQALNRPIIPYLV